MERIAQIRRFVIDTFLFGDGLVLNDDTSFMEKRVIDSTGMVELISFIETNFGIRIEDTELIRDNLDSLRKIDAFVNRKLGAAGAGQPGAPLA